MRKADSSVPRVQAHSWFKWYCPYAFMYQIGGRGSKRQTVSLGNDEFLTLQQARDMAVKFRALVVQGLDPQVVEQTTKKKNNQPRLDDVMARYIEINKKPGRYWHERINQIEWVISVMGKATTR